MATILVVDDRPTNREFLVTLLGYAGHRLLEASDGAQALGIARAERLDLIITDILMPTMDGIEFVRQVRADPTIAQTPIIFYTATYLEREAHVLAQAAGVHHVLSKPAEPQAVLDMVNAALGLPALPPQPPPPIEAELTPLSVLSRKLSEKAGQLDTFSLRLATLAELSLETGSEREPQRLLEKFCGAMRKLIGAKYAAIGILDEAGQTLRYFVTSGLDAETIARIGSPPVGKGLLGYVLAERRPLRVPNIDEHPRSAGFPPHHPPMRSFLGVPIASAARVYGRLYLADKLGADEFSEEDEQVAVALAAQVAVGFENVRLYDDIQRRAADLEREIIQRRRAETQLRRAEAKYRALVEQIPAVVYTIGLDPARTLLYISPKIEQLLGFTASEWLADPDLWRKQLHPDDRERMQAEAARSHTAGAPLRAEYRLLSRDGHVVWVRDEATLVRGYVDQPVFLQGVMLDITERKQAEVALRESESQLSLVYGNVSDIIFYLAVEPDDRFRFLSVNPAFSKATGLTESQVVGKLVQEVIPEPAHALVFGNYREAIRDRKTIKWEEVSVYPAGTKHGEVSVTPIFDANGHCTNLIGTVHDITERKQAEEEIHQLNAELEQRVLERTAQLEAANQELEAFSYSVSHDLRAPLRAVIGFAKVVLEDYAERLDAEGRRYLNAIHDSAKNMGQLIDDLLTLSRLGRQEMTFSEINMTALAQLVAEELRQAQPERALQFIIPALPTARGDRALIRQVWINLLSNAVKFTASREQAVIEVGGKAGASENVYSVKDNGVGFDNRYVDKLFGVFQRLHGADEFEGTGIGLSVVRRVIRRHGGEVRAEGQVDQGATFYFTLPIKGDER